MTADLIEKVFNALADNEAYLTKQSFIKNMKKYRISLFARLSPDSPDYEASCSELFQVFVSQFQEASAGPDFNRESNEELPDFLRFMQASVEGPLKSSVAVPKGVEALTKEQFV
eukprot:TRINITY_DN869_c0_g1_i5.p6 TRINITY_DN869_c0_g1~~TRINITY_DN869_c0_g1_i5.p6  ORF type:complete len:114 (+),score=41.94 TRINITY_DN869_c0_g1_i5:115-456(+)